MSVSGEQDIRCPCGEEFEAQLWSAVNAKTEPALRDEILAGQLNVVRCPKCGQMIYAEQFLLYHDPARGLLAFVYPKDHESHADVWREKTAEDFRTAQEAIEPDKRLKYQAFAVFGMDGLVDLLQGEQEAEDQAAIFESLASSAHVEVFAVDPEVARRHHIPRSLPLKSGGEKPFEERLREGLELILQANDRLSLYEALQDRLVRHSPESSGLLLDIEGSAIGLRKSETK